MRMGRRIATVLAAAATTAATMTAVTAVTASSAHAADPTAPDHLVIAAVYGSDGGAYNSDWVELYNPTDADISLGTVSGSTVTPSYYQCYRSISGTSCSSMKLYGTVRAHHYFLIWDGHNAAAGTSRGAPPAGVTPDLNFALDAGNTAGTSTDPSGQSNTGFGGYSTGGQILLLSAASNGTYAGTGDLSSAAAKAAGVVDAVAWTKYAAGPPAVISQPGSAETGGSTVVTGASAGTSNSYVAARTFVNGLPQDTDTNASDFSALTTADFTIHSQASDHVTVAKVSDAEISRGEAMTPIQVQGSTSVGTLSYAADGLPDGVTIDPTTGIIGGTPSATADLKDYPVTIVVTDTWPTGSETASTTFTLTVSSALRVDSIADASVHKGAALTPIEVTTHGGTPDYNFTATGLPEGVDIDPSSGEISGTSTDKVGHYGVHVTVTDGGTPAKSASVDFALVELPKSTAPSSTDPLAGLKINEVTATGTPADDWVELYNTGADITDASVSLVDGDGDSYQLPTQSIDAGAYVVVGGADLDAAGLDLTAQDTLDLTESDDTVLDETSWTSYPSTSWARYPDGTGDFTVSSKATEGAANLDPALDTDHLVIAAVFGANSDSARWSNDWVELYNPTDNPISLGSIDTTTTPNATVTPHYDLCYRTYSSTTACSSLVKLYGTVAPHHYFLVWYGNAHTPVDHGAYSPGFTPDLDVSVATPANGNQSSSNMGGCNTGGQIELLDATKGTSAINGDLSSAAAKTAGEVDGVGWMNASTNQPSAAESNGSSKVTGVDSGTNNTCVIMRKFADGYPVDANANSTDFTPVTGIDRVAVTPVGNTEISLGEAMNPITVQAQAIFGALTYSADGLPAGVTIDKSTGVISGTPGPSDDLKDYPITVTVGDDMASDTTTTVFTLTVSKELRLQPIADTIAHQGTALTAIQVQAHGGGAPYAYGATGLPTGVTIDKTSGLISGTPTDALGRYSVHVTVTDSSVTKDSASRDFTLVELPNLSAPASGDPLAGLTINEVKATGMAANDWIELYNTGTGVTGTSVRLVDSEGDTDQVPAQNIDANGYTVISGSALKAAGFDLAAKDTLYLTETDDTLLDSTSWTSYAATSWARTTDGTGTFGVSGHTTKGKANNSDAPAVNPNDLLVSEVNYDTNSTDYYEYSEITNTTDHAIDFAASGLTLTKSGAVMTLHDPSDTTATSPIADPVIPAHGTQLFWWVETNYLGVKTTAQFLANYGLPASTPVVLVQGFGSMANSGGDRSYDISVNQGATTISQAWVDTPCAAGTVTKPGINGTLVCTPTNGNYAEHYELPSDLSNPVATVWYNSLHSGGDDINYALKTALSSPGTVDLEQLGFSRALTLGDVSGTSVEIDNGSAAAVELSGYVLQTKNGSAYTFPTGTSVAANGSLTLSAATSGLDVSESNYVELLAPQGYDYTDGLGLIDTTGPLLQGVPYGKDSGGAPVIDVTTGLPLPPAGGLYRPAGVSADNGTVYVSNTGDNVLASLTGGSLSTVAGSLANYGDLGDEGLATAAELYQPGGTAKDAAGNIFIADSGDNVIREITTDGKIHRFAGTGLAGGAGAAVTSTSTPVTVNLWHPDGVAVDGDDNVFIADTYDNRVVEVTAAGAIKVIAGTGKAGYTGDGAAATSARLALPAGLAVDAKDNVYLADSANNVVRRVDASSGAITTVAGNYAAGQVSNDCLGGYSGDGGQATAAQLNDPQGVALDGSGDLFIADTFNNAIREVAPDGTISTLVNVGGVAGAESLSPVATATLPASTRLNTPYAVAVDQKKGVLYVADTRNSAIADVLHVAFSGDAAGPIEPADQVAVTGSGKAATACAAATNGPVTATTAPSITGKSAVGSTLTAAPGTWTPTPDSFAYQWLRTGVAIAGATKATYTVTAADARHALTVSVTALKEDFGSTSANSHPVSIPAPAPPVVKPNPALQKAQAKLAHDRAVLAKHKVAKKKAQKILRSKHSSRAAKAKAHKKITHLNKLISRLKKAIKADERAVRSAS
ncbi:putative Ig domain-containing protein [Nocardioides sp. Iso805N]|uniref:putative Ig domain-containing protein n=1 Tax=Nocardioides sp. Iso805N TaxID=1283287 RepID=UPI0012FB125A|nr:putative Ig domain-containing protein [Nocardioides sp. Iso805N]